MFLGISGATVRFGGTRVRRACSGNQIKSAVPTARNKCRINCRFLRLYFFVGLPPTLMVFPGGRGWETLEIPDTQLRHSSNLIFLQSLSSLHLPGLIVKTIDHLLPRTSSLLGMTVKRLIHVSTRIPLPRRRPRQYHATSPAPQRVNNRQPY